MKFSRPAVHRGGWFFSVAMLSLAARSHAGMTSYTVSDVARLRVEELSFFAVVFLLCVAGIKGIWNAFVRDFPTIPKLDWKRAFTFTTLLRRLSESTSAAQVVDLEEGGDYEHLSAAQPGGASLA